MTYGVHAYAVHLQELIDAIGSGRADLVAAMRRTCAERIRQYDSAPANRRQERAFPLNAAVEELIMGDLDHEWYWLNDTSSTRCARLGYAVECLASCLGKGQLGTSEITSISGDWLYDQPVLNRLCGDPGPLKDVVPMYSDFPAICVIPFEHLNDTFDAIDQAMATNGDPQAKPCYQELCFWLNQAAMWQRGLVTFYY